MGKPCRLSFLAYRDHDATALYGEGSLDDFTEANLENGIAYCAALIEYGLSYEPLDDFELKGFIDWAEATMRRGENAWINAA